jgi:hypothetical protein
MGTENESRRPVISCTIGVQSSDGLVPSREWLEFEGVVISALFQPTEFECTSEGWQHNCSDRRFRRGLEFDEASPSGIMLSDHAASRVPIEGPARGHELADSRVLSNHSRSRSHNHCRR